jgi:hypothetical protein
VISIHKVILCGSLCLLLAAACAAQDDPCLHRTVAVNVFEAGAGIVSGLRPQDFRVEMKGATAEIRSAEVDRSPHRVIVVLDSSGSMFGEHMWPVAKAFASDVFAFAPGRLRAGLIVFNDKVRAKIPAGYDPEAVRRALEELPASPSRKDHRTGRKTALLDALTAAVGVLEPAQFGDAIYAVTDGGENASATTMKPLLSILQARGIRLHVELVGIGEGARATMEELTGPLYLADLVLDAGGSMERVDPKRYGLSRDGSLNAEASQRVRETALGFYTAMQFPYRLEIALSNPIEKPEKWKLSVPKTKERRAALLVSYARRLSGCPAPSSAAKN